MVKYGTLGRYFMVLLGVATLSIGGAYAATTYVPPSQQGGSPNPPSQQTRGYGGSAYGNDHAHHHSPLHGSVSSSGGTSQSPSAQQSMHAQGATRTD